MKIKNNTKNTLYLEDVDIHLPYKNGEIEEVTPDLLKKSKCLRSFILDGTLEVIDYSTAERVENSLIYMRNKILLKPKPVVKEVKPEPVSLPEPVSPRGETPVAEQPNLPSPNANTEILLHGIFYDAGGYGKVNRNLALQLSKLGFKIKVEPKRSMNQLREDELAPIAALEKTKISRNHIRIDSVVPTFAEATTGKYKILYTTIESYTVPKQFLECCELYNEIWTTSGWSAEILKKYVSKPIYVVPAGVDEKLYVPQGPAFDFRPNVKKFVFLSVFGWGYRKGYDVLLKAYFDEFSSEDEVSLLLASRYQGGITKFHRDKIKADIEVIMKGFPNKNLPHIVRYSDVLPEKEMPKLYRAAHCFVLPSRGEGSNLCAVEAALCNLPVIMTNVSGQSMYLRPDNSYLIEMDYLSKIQTGQMSVHFWDGQEFPDLRSPEVHNQLRKAMREVYDDYMKYGYREPKMRVKKMQELILNNFTWTHTGRAAEERLKEIAGKMN